MYYNFYNFKSIMNLVPNVKMDIIPDDTNEPIIIDDTMTAIEEQQDENEDEKIEIIPNVVKKEKKAINEDEIFVDAPVKLTKKGKPDKRKTRVLSEEHKRKMREAREKTQKEKRDATNFIKQKKDLVRQKKLLEVQALKKEIDNTPKPDPINQRPASPTPPSPRRPTPPPPKIRAASPQPRNVDIEKAVLDGITKYEILRKTRKEEKKKNKAVQDEHDKIQATIMRAMQPRNHRHSYGSLY